MEIRAFLTLDLVFIIIIYLAFLLFIHAPRTVVLLSLLGGLVMALINIGVDIVAHYANIWQYTLSGLILYVPLPFYISTVLFYGSVVYLLIWRFWTGRGRWFALVLLIGMPIFGVVRDAWGGLFVHSPYNATWNSPFAMILSVVMWAVMFYSGFLLFRRLAPSREEVLEQEMVEEAEHRVPSNL